MKKPLLALLIVCLPLTPATAASLSATCHAEYGLTTEKLPVAASSDVFAFHSVNLNDRFLFKAQYLQERSKLKTYVYELISDSSRLIHMSEHLLFPQRCPTQPESLGLNKVYSSDLEREIFFQCFVSCE